MQDKVVHMEDMNAFGDSPQQSGVNMISMMDQEFNLDEYKRGLEKSAQQLAHQLAHQLAQDMAQDMAQGMAQNMAQDMAQNMAQEIAQDMAIKKMITCLRQAGWPDKQIVTLLLKNGDKEDDIAKCLKEL